MTGDDDDERLAQQDVEGTYFALIDKCSSCDFIFSAICVCRSI